MFLGFVNYCWKGSRCAGILIEYAVTNDDSEGSEDRILASSLEDRIVAVCLVVALLFAVCCWLE